MTQKDLKILDRQLFVVNTVDVKSILNFCFLMTTDDLSVR